MLHVLIVKRQQPRAVREVKLAGGNAFAIRQRVDMSTARNDYTQVGNVSPK